MPRKKLPSTHDQLKEQNKTITANHFNIIQNNIITMNPVKFLNTYCKNNPSIYDVVERIETRSLNSDTIEAIKTGISLNNHNIIGGVMNDILKEANRELIDERGVEVGTCNNVLFVNDGSTRRYITKNDPEWDYCSNNDLLDRAACHVIDETIRQDMKLEYYPNKKDRDDVHKVVKRKNDWNSNKDQVLETILVQEEKLNNIENDDIIKSI